MILARHFWGHKLRWGNSANVNFIRYILEADTLFQTNIQGGPTVGKQLHFKDFAINQLFNYKPINYCNFFTIRLYHLTVYLLMGHLVYWEFYVKNWLQVQKIWVIFFKLKKNYYKRQVFVIDMVANVFEDYH